MNQYDTFNAELYALSNTATIIMDRFAFGKITMPAFLRRMVLKTTNLVLYRVGPSTVKKRRELYNETGGDIFNRVNLNINVKLYIGEDYYIGTTLDRVFIQDTFAVYDNQSSVIYEIRHDSELDTTT